MIRVNEHYLKLQAGYLFPEISRRVSAFAAQNPKANIIRMGIGDVTEPLVPAVVEAMHKAVDEMGGRATLKGYGPEQGYDFLRQAILDNDYKARGVDLAIDEIFVSDGSKCDTGNLQEIFGLDNTIAVTDPVYPVYVDTNVMAGRTGAGTGNGQYAGNRLYALHARQSVRPPVSVKAGGYHLPVLPEQPDRGGGHAPATVAMGGLCPTEQGGDPVRRRLRGLYLRSVDSPFDLRDPRSPTGGHRVPQFLQDGRIHRVASAPLRWFPRMSWPMRPTAGRFPSIPCGIAVIAPSSTVPASSRRRPPPRSILPQENSKADRSSSCICKTPRRSDSR